ncbi:MAG: 3-dehydroquinate synthase [Clostridia bacterium]|nr:3-dehydroquinate synthase [Clostridia bacterium]
MTEILHMNLGKESYDIVVERGALARVGELLDLNRRVLIITDDGVSPAYAETVAEACAEPIIATYPQGEDTKSFEVLADVCAVMLENGFTRTDCVVAVGGGVIGDLAGFAAASFMRGIDFYNIPTTLLSQVDSSIGGKTAINHEGIKNCIGAFYQPKKVIIDPNVLSTLPARQVSSGMAEAIKMAATCDRALFEKIEAGNPMDMLDEIIVSSLKIKKYVVEQDAKEKSLRRVLNFGHTLGHGIESQAALLDGNRALYHGECVALGMLPMCSPTVRDRLITVLKKAGLPTETDIDMNAALAAVSHDKKMDGSKINYVYCPEIGTFEFRSASLDEYAEVVLRGTSEGIF